MLNFNNKILTNSIYFIITTGFGGALIGYSFGLIGLYTGLIIGVVIGLGASFSVANRKESKNFSNEFINKSGLIFSKEPRLVNQVDEQIVLINNLLDKAKFIEINEQQYFIEKENYKILLESLKKFSDFALNHHYHDYHNCHNSTEQEFRSNIRNIEQLMDFYLKNHEGKNKYKEALFIYNSILRLKSNYLEGKINHLSTKDKPKHINE